MNSAISEGVSIEVETFYQPDYSNPAKKEYLFAYRITIKNHNNFPVQLISRYWNIFDSDGTKKEVEGEGVVGNQPVILPSETYQYISSCLLHTEIGRMKGAYLMQNLHSKKMLNVTIPTFMLQAPPKLN